MPAFEYQQVSKAEEALDVSIKCVNHIFEQCTSYLSTIAATHDGWPSAMNVVDSAVPIAAIPPTDASKWWIDGMLSDLRTVLHDFLSTRDLTFHQEIASTTTEYEAKIRRMELVHADRLAEVMAQHEKELDIQAAAYNEMTDNIKRFYKQQLHNETQNVDAKVSHRTKEMRAQIESLEWGRKIQVDNIRELEEKACEAKAASAEHAKAANRHQLALEKEIRLNRAVIARKDDKLSHAAVIIENAETERRVAVIRCHTQDCQIAELTKERDDHVERNQYLNQRNEQLQREMRTVEIKNQLAHIVQFGELAIERESLFKTNRDLHEANELQENEICKLSEALMKRDDDIDQLLAKNFHLQEEMKRLREDIELVEVEKIEDDVEVEEVEWVEEVGEVEDAEDEEDFEEDEDFEEVEDFE
ncbi:hypothetical protein SCUP234_09861 [Seiridium cupressi]